MRVTAHKHIWWLVRRLLSAAILWSRIFLVILLFCSRTDDGALQLILGFLRYTFEWSHQPQKNSNLNFEWHPKEANMNCFDLNPSSIFLIHWNPHPSRLQNLRQTFLRFAPTERNLTYLCIATCTDLPSTYAWCGCAWINEGNHPSVFPMDWVSTVTCKSQQVLLW